MRTREEMYEHLPAAGPDTADAAKIQRAILEALLDIRELLAAQTPPKR